ncbi:hypothetical protein D3C73_796680 [compost metagenome]
MDRTETQQARKQPELRHGVRSQHGDGIGGAGGADALPGRVDAVQRGQHFIVIHQARGTELDPACLAGKQLDTQRLLQRAYLFADGALRDTEFGGRAGEALQAGHRFEGDQCVEGWHVAKTSSHSSVQGMPNRNVSMRRFRYIGAAISPSIVTLING